MGKVCKPCAVHHDCNHPDDTMRDEYDLLADVTVIVWCKDHKCLEYNCPPGTTSHRLVPFGSMSAVREVVEGLQARLKVLGDSFIKLQQGDEHRRDRLERGE